MSDEAIALVRKIFAGRANNNISKSFEENVVRRLAYSTALEVFEYALKDDIPCLEQFDCYE